MIAPGPLRLFTLLATLAGCSGPLPIAIAPPATTVDPPRPEVLSAAPSAAPSAPAAEPAPRAPLSGDPFVVRDGTGAPVARLHERKDRLELVEVGGGPIAQCWRSPVDLGWLIDEQWGLTVLDEPVVLDRRALVAFPLVCRLLWSQPCSGAIPSRPACS